MSVLGELGAALAAGTVEVVDLTTPLDRDTPILRLPEPFANTVGLSMTPVSAYDEAGPGVEATADGGVAAAEDSDIVVADDTLGADSETDAPDPEDEG